jgi:hypothetical protein
MQRIHQPIRIALVAGVFVVCESLAFGQSTANPPVGGAAANSPTSTQTQVTNPAGGDAGAQSASPGNTTRKANAKAARAKNKAELSKLEKNGYKPSAQEADYPNNIQNAEKKANGQ